MKRKLGDRWDGRLIKDVDSMHFIMPIIYPNRCDNEAFVSERIDLTALNEFLLRKNAENPEYKYNMFQVIVAAVLKIIKLRPKMNYFIANGSMYERNEVSASFVIKKVFADDSEEGLARIRAKDGDNLDSVHDAIFKRISACRGENKKVSTEDALDFFNKLPRGLSKFLVRIIMKLEKRGLIPKSFVAGDPYYSSVILTNLGSIKLHSGYHHLTNWGTTSLFVVVGEKKLRPFYDDAGNVTMRDSIDLGLTVDERIADGYYFSKTIRLLKKLLENPELLERPFEEEVNYE